MTMNDNPNAFPQSYQNRDASGAWFTDHDHGMTLRDYFAGQALTGVIRTCAGDNWKASGHRSIEAYFAFKTYAIADAMLAARTGDA